MAQLPVFTPSGQGGQADLKNILQSQIIAWGGFRFKFNDKYENIAGTSIIDGHEVFNSLQLKGHLNEGDEIREFMEFIGFTDEELDDMNTDFYDSDYKVEQAYLEYIANESYEKDDYDFIMYYILS